MSNYKQTAPIVALIPALPGIRSVFIEHDTDGKPVMLEGSADQALVGSEPVAFWGLLPPSSSLGFGLFGSDGNASVVPLGIDAEAALAKGNPPRRLNYREGFLGYAFPGETVPEAIDRIERPHREALAKAEERERERLAAQAKARGA